MGAGGECVECVPGKFKSIVGKESCHTCDIGKYSETRGATDHFTCIDCPKGKYLPRNFPKYVRAPANARWIVSWMHSCGPESES
jgi:hypothetical protein